MPSRISLATLLFISKMAIITGTFIIGSLLTGCTLLTSISRAPVSTDFEDDVNVAQQPDTKAATNDQPDSDITLTESAVSTESANSFECLGIREKAAQLIAVLLTAKELQFMDPLVESGELGFISLVGKHDIQVKDTLARLQAKATVPLLVASDEESASVQRLAKAIKPLPTVRQLLGMSTESVRKLYKDYGDAMVALGVTINFAPVIDVGFGPGIGTRSLGDTPEAVIAFARAIADGLRDAGVLPVFKHFPGHGSASGDSHKVLPTTRKFTSMAPDLAPYRALLTDPAGVMIGHLIVPGLTGESPTSLSPRTIDKLLRTHLGFDGLVFTDALNMGAITDSYSTSEAAIAAISAGADVVMIAGHSSIKSLLDSILDAIDNGKLSQQRITQSAGKILQYKGFKCTSDQVINTPLTVKQASTPVPN